MFKFEILATKNRSYKKTFSVLAGKHVRIYNLKLEKSEGARCKTRVVKLVKKMLTKFNVFFLSPAVSHHVRKTVSTLQQV